MAAVENEIVKIRQEIARLDELLLAHYEEMRGVWTFRLGQIKLVSDFKSTAITKVYITFIILCAIVGGVLTFSEPAKELGIALLAGAILALGSFTSQFWAVAVQRDRAFYDALVTRAKHRELEHLWKRRDHLQDRLEEISE